MAARLADEQRYPERSYCSSLVTENGLNGDVFHHDNVNASTRQLAANTQAESIHASESSPTATGFASS